MRLDVSKQRKWIHQRLRAFQVLRPAAAGGGPSGRLAEGRRRRPPAANMPILAELRPIAAKFLPAPTPQCARWVGWWWR